MGSNLLSNDTIVAVATPPGRGGIGVVRLSGPACLAILQALFIPSDPDFSGFRPRFLHFGRVRDAGGEPLDEALAVLMPGPRSFTGQDVAEIHCHGSPAVLAEVHQAACGQGARPALPGEFTRRAFLAGRIDLTRAEAVAEMVAAPTPAAAHLARAKLDGALQAKVDGLRDRLLDLRAQLCVAIDFPEDEVDCLDPDELARRTRSALDDLRALASGYGRARLWRQGAMVVLAGRVNAGKSSLMNALLGRCRAIVADTPGTTRDYLEESLDLDGLPVRLVDTAGLRPSGEIVGDGAEAQGQRMGRDLSERADLVLLVVDAVAGPDEGARELASALGPDRVLAVSNKIDLLPESPRGDALPGMETVAVSARTGLGLDALAARVRARLAQGRGVDLSEPAPNLRQAQALDKAGAELEALLADLAQGVPYDLLAVRLESACVLLDEITGRIVPEEVLHSVFDSFCIGK